MRDRQHKQILSTVGIEAEKFAKRLRGPETMNVFQAFAHQPKFDFSKSCNILPGLHASLRSACARAMRRRGPWV